MYVLHHLYVKQSLLMHAYSRTSHISLLCLSFNHAVMSRLLPGVSGVLMICLVMSGLRSELALETTILGEFDQVEENSCDAGHNREGCMMSNNYSGKKQRSICTIVRHAK